MDGWAVPGYTESLELGSGASGRVVLAVHEETGVPVAVKYLSESLRTRPGFVRGFRAEARLLAGLDSPHVAGLYEYVESPDGAAIVMELVEGVCLRALLKRRGPLEPEAALAVLKGSLLGLADAHRVGVVHRDYKPENVLVVPDGTSTLVDFGIAVDAGTGGGVAGTPAYMAPEQWTGAPASPAADVYAATATFFECLTGHRPYPGDNLAALALQHVDAPVPAEEVPGAVRDLVRRGLAKDPDVRPAGAEAFVAELEAVAGAAYGEDWDHAILGASEHCVATHPSDMGVALTALDARVSYETADGPGELPITDLYLPVGETPHRETALPRGALITAVTLPPAPTAANSRYRKVRERVSYAFAIGSVAAALDVRDGVVHDVRLAFGAVASRPWRAFAAERVLTGAPAGADTFAAAADAELAAARPLPRNGYKVTLMRNLVVAVLSELAEEAAR